MFRITSRRLVGALGIAAAVAVAGGIQLSSAQTAPRGLPNYQNAQPGQQYDRPDGRADGGQIGNQNDRRRDARITPEQRLDRRLAFLHDRLRITPAQERGWTAFAAVLHENMQDRIRGRDVNDRRAPPSVVDELERNRQRLVEAAQHMDHMLNALRPLYASFSDDQKRTADRLMFRVGEGFRERLSGRGADDRGPGFGAGPNSGPPR